MILFVGISTTHTIENCTCGHYAATEYVGPFCDKWNDDPPFCYLAGREKAQNCPGAQESDENLYWTEDASVCNASIRPQSVPWGLAGRQPSNLRDILKLSFYSVQIFIGTIGNALVVKHFAFGDVSIRPGARFVVVLAMLDFVSSIWFPGLVIVDTLYESPVSAPWPFGKLACQISLFWPLLTYATSWLLLAISLERARAIFRPFRDKLRAKFVIVSSIMILACSFFISFKTGLRIRYYPNLPVYVDGTLYEYADCSVDLSGGDPLIEFFIAYTIGLWIPMLVIPIVYIQIYLELKKQTQLRKYSSTHEPSAQLTRISRTFISVLVVFYVCYLPTTIIDAIYVYSVNAEMNVNTDLLDTSYVVTQSLLFSNSCLNPVIYSKIHLKIYHYIKQLIRTCRRGIWPSQKAIETLPLTTLKDNQHSQTYVSENVESENTV